MEKKQNFQTKVWLSMDKLNDHFSRLGGSGRYTNFYETDIPNYIIGYLLSLYDSNFNLENYVNRELSNPTRTDLKKLLESVQKHLNEIKIDSNYIFLIDEYWYYIDNKFDDIEKSFKWNKLRDVINFYKNELSNVDL